MKLIHRKLCQTFCKPNSGSPTQMRTYFNGLKITRFAESCWSFHNGSQKVNTFFTGLTPRPSATTHASLPLAANAWWGGDEKLMFWGVGLPTVQVLTSTLPTPSGLCEIGMAAGSKRVAFKKTFTPTGLVAKDKVAYVLTQLRSPNKQILKVLI